MMEKTKYVLGFMFSKDYEKVAVIQKTKPAWQSGLLNGIGGKVEEGELYRQAMTREFFEETGSNEGDWQEVGQMQGKDWIVVVFACTGDLRKLRTTTEEQVMTITVSSMTDCEEQLIDNLPWLIPVCRHHLSLEAIKFDITYPEHE